MRKYHFDIPRSVNLLEALSHPQRYRIVSLLRTGEKDVTSIMELLRTRQSTTSHHLRKLRDAGMVRTRRNAKSVFYSLTAPEAETLVTSLESWFTEQGNKVP